MAQILQIAKQSLNDFPELIEKGYSEGDISRVWRSYEKEMNNFLLDPSDIYFKLFGVIYFGLDYIDVGKKLKKDLQYSRTLQATLGEIDFEKLKTRIIKLEKLINRKIEHYKDVLYYIEDYKEAKGIHILNYRIGRLEEFKQICKEIISNYDKGIITRDLEKQSSNSRGNKESNI